MTAKVSCPVPVAQWLAIRVGDPPSKGPENSMTGDRISFARLSKTRVEVGVACAIIQNFSDDLRAPMKNLGDKRPISEFARFPYASQSACLGSMALSK
jgi:hypothetical protein